MIESLARSIFQFMLHLSTREQFWARELPGPLCGPCTRPQGTSCYALIMCALHTHPLHVHTITFFPLQHAKISSCGPPCMIWFNKVGQPDTSAGTKNVSHYSVCHVNIFAYIHACSLKVVFPVYNLSFHIRHAVFARYSSPENYSYHQFIIQNIRNIKTTWCFCLSG